VLLALVAALLALAFARVTPVLAAGVVGTGTFMTRQSPG
jgi:hypothetical protein